MKTLATYGTVSVNQLEVIPDYFRRYDLDLNH